MNASRAYARSAARTPCTFTCTFTRRIQNRPRETREEGCPWELRRRGVVPDGIPGSRQDGKEKGNAYRRKAGNDALRAYHLRRVTSQFKTTISVENARRPPSCSRSMTTKAHGMNGRAERNERGACPAGSPFPYWRVRAGSWVVLLDVYAAVVETPVRRPGFIKADRREQEPEYGVQPFRGSRLARARPRFSGRPGQSSRPALPHRAG